MRTPSSPRAPRPRPSGARTAVLEPTPPSRQAPSAGPDAPPRATTSRARAAVPGAGRLDAHDRVRLTDVAAGVAVGAAAAGVLALALLSGLPGGLAAAFGLLLGLAVGGVVLATWARAAVGGGASASTARTHAMVALAAAGAAAATPLVLALLLAG